MIALNTLNAFRLVNSRLYIANCVAYLVIALTNQLRAEVSTQVKQLNHNFRNASY